MLEQPKSMNELVYHTIRAHDNGQIRAWVFKKKCESCKKGLMSKPIDEKTGRPKIRATEYVCPVCGHSVPKKTYEESLTVNISYDCPYCKKSGETQIPFKRKKFKGVDALVFECGFCKEKIPITKKLKELKK